MRVPQKGLFSLTLPYLRDVHDHVLMMMQQLDAVMDLLTSFQNTYLANVSIEVAQSSHEVNRQMNHLSAFATALIPLSLITGLFGVNVRVPFQSDENPHSLVPFTVLASVMILLAILLAGCLKCRHWF